MTNLDSDAALGALDKIATICGCPSWDYPGQVVRDVQQLQGERDAARLALASTQQELEEVRAALNTVCSAIERAAKELG